MVKRGDMTSAKNEKVILSSHFDFSASHPVQFFWQIRQSSIIPSSKNLEVHEVFFVIENF